MWVQRRGGRSRGTTMSFSWRMRRRQWQLWSQSVTQTSTWYTRYSTETLRMSYSSSSMECLWTMRMISVIRRSGWRCKRLGVLGSLREGEVVRRLIGGGRLISLFHSSSRVYREALRLTLLLRGKEVVRRVNRYCNSSRSKINSQEKKEMMGLC